MSSTAPKPSNTTHGGRLSAALRIEWLGQMAASLLWIASVLSYGITSTGDYLQICAASAWAVANIAAIATPR